MLIKSGTEFYDSKLGNYSFLYVGDKHTAQEDIPVDSVSLFDPERRGFIPYLVSEEAAKSHNLLGRVIWVP